jgi:hypothetical protein
LINAPAEKGKEVIGQPLGEPRSDMLSEIADQTSRRTWGSGLVELRA